jgi:type I restriction enzyme, S subunit
MRIAKLGEVFKITSGGTPNRSVNEYYDGGTIPWVKTGDLKVKNVFEVDEFITEAGLSNSSAKIFPKNTVLIAMYGATIGACSILGIEAATNQACAALLPSNEVDTSYLYFYLLFIRPKLVNKGIGGGQPNISATILKEVEFPLPDLQTQKQIAQILESADYARQQRKKATALTEQFLQSSFLHLFGDPVENEKGWPSRTLKDVGQLDRGKSKHRPRNAPELLNGPYPLIQTGDVANCKGYIYNYYQTYSEIGLKQSKIWKAGTLCITIAANIAKTGILMFDSCFPDSVVGFTPNEQVTTEYVQYWISFLQKTLEENAPESAQKNINLDILRKLAIPIPPLSLQQQFAAIVADTEHLRQKQQENEQELVHLFQALLQQYFGAEAMPVIKAIPEALPIAAEPAVPYQTATSSIPENKRGFAKYVLAGKIISECRNTEDFTHIKFQKLQHLAEYLLQEELEQNFYYQAAGPYDNKMMHNLAPKMRQQKWFTEDFYVFHPLDKAPEIDGYFNRYFGSKKTVLDKLLHLLGNATEDKCEIISTLFAIWNDMLIQKETISDTEIIKRFYQWSDRKKKYVEDQLLKALQWMRKEEITPVGFGPLIKHKKS